VNAAVGYGQRTILCGIGGPAVEQLLKMTRAAPIVFAITPPIQSALCRTLFCKGVATFRGSLKITDLGALRPYCYFPLHPVGLFGLPVVSFFGRSVAAIS
jgi:hypothetical protein